MTATEQFQVNRVSPSYWRVTFDNGPVNLLDSDTIEQLAGLLGAIENDPDLTVVVFRSEFVLATDIRFASEQATLGQFEIGVGSVPGGGPMARLGRLVGRGRALEILLGGDDFPADLAAAYGYVNRVVPDAEIEDFVDRLARRIAGFDKVAVAGVKKLVDVATLPDDAELGAGLTAYFATAGRPEHRPFVELLFKNGLQQADGVEKDLGVAIGELGR